MAQALFKPGHSLTVATGRYGDSPSNFTEDEIKVRRIMSWRRAARSVTSGPDVYEGEEQFSSRIARGLILSDDVFARLLAFPNVIVTGHQAFFTREALENIAATTIDNVTGFEQGQTLGNQLAG